MNTSTQFIRSYRRPGRLNWILCLILFTSIANWSFAQENKELLQSKLNEEKTKLKWQDSDISEWKISSQHTDKNSGITHSYIQQYYKGIAVYNAISIYAIKNNSVVYFKPGLVSQLEKKINTTSAGISPKRAIEAAANHLELQPGDIKAVESDEAAHKYSFKATRLSNRNITVQLEFAPKNGKLLLAWDVSIDMIDGQHWWNVRVDATTGAYIDKNDYVSSCSLEDHDHEYNSEETTLMNNNNSAMFMNSLSTYNVYPFPTEAPNFGSRSLLNDPADPVASPFGWHDVDGVTGAEYTITRGNNVYAYEDSTPPTGPPGYSPDGGASLNFDYPLNLTIAPANNIDASITNMFYAINTLHDKLDFFGFDEASGNFQENNYGNGGLGGDAVNAENFDYSGLNNANFATPPDGQSGRMQMYLWAGTPCDNLTIASTGINGPMVCRKGDFSPIATAAGQLILIDDGAGNTSDGCSLPINSLAGKIVLIDRGSCPFAIKAQNAQDAGAIGVIIANNVPGAGANVMGGSGSFTIPIVSVSYEDGVLLKNELISGLVSATITTCAPTLIDGSLDNGLIAHEFGHGVSSRLTGGPANTGCVENRESGSEGWSDWLALISTIKPSDNGATPRGMFTFSAGQASSGPGVRRFPYSTDMTINPQTYADLALSSEIHDVGEIWCDPIWDMTWFLINQYGFDSNPANANAGNNIAMRLVLEGMKLQPCNPGFLDSRDAILTADLLLYNNAHRCLIWQAFARRGMGILASQGSSSIVGDETPDFTEAFCTACTGTPEAGTVVASANEVCSIENINLSLRGVDFTTGLTYQWQSSADNIAWNNITGANYYNYSTSQSTATWYRCYVVCTSSSLADTTAGILVGIINNCVTIDNTVTNTCLATFYDTGLNGGNYGDMETFVHTFAPDPNMAIKLSWDYFESELDYDFITIYDGPDDTYPVLFGPASGTQFIPDFISSHPSGKLTVKFTSDQLVNERGWVAHVTCVVPTNSVVIDNTVTNTCSATFYDTGLSGGNYGDMETFVHTFAPDPNMRIKLSWDYFESELDYDYITIYDGPDDTYPVLFGPASGTLLIPDFISSHSSGKLTVKFTSDQFVTARGWVAHVTCVPSCPFVDDLNPCTIDGCDPVTGAPTHTQLVLNVTATITDRILCYGGTACVDITATGGSAPYNGGGQYCNLLSNTYTIYIFDNNGCPGSVTFELRQPTKLTVSASSTPTSCAVNNGTVSAVASDGTPGYGFIWKDAANTIVGTADIVTGLGGGTYTVIVTDANGCTATASTIVSVIGGPPASPGSITGPSGVCKGQNGVQFCVPNDPTVTNYLWTLPIGVTGSSTGNCITVNISNQFTGGLICVTAHNACGNSTPSCMGLTLVTAKPVKPSPITGPSPLCAGTVATYCVSPIPNAASYNWVIGGNGGANPLTIISGQGTPCVVVNIPAGYNSSQELKVKAQNCKGLSDERKLKITVTPKPAMPGSISGPSTVCKNQIGFYSISSVANASTYSWSVTGNVWVAGGQGTTSLALDFSTSTTTSAVLSVNASNACGTSATRTKTITINNCRETADLSAVQTGNLTNVNVYPNPSHGNISLDFISTSEANSLLRLTDITGKLIMQTEFKSVIGENHHELDLTNVAKGAYLLILNTNDGKSVTRLFIE